ncbi:hypothetical protein D9M68_804630 [compost metagenome]
MIDEICFCFVKGIHYRHPRLDSPVMIFRYPFSVLTQVAAHEAIVSITPSVTEILLLGFFQKSCNIFTLQRLYRSMQFIR